MSIIDDSYRKEFNRSLKLLQKIAEEHINNEELLDKINEIKWFEMVNGEFANTQNPLSPLPSSCFKFLLENMAEFVNNRDKLEEFIDEILEEQTKQNINRAAETYAQPLFRSADNFYNFLATVNHYISNIPASKITNYSTELSELKQQVDIMEKEMVSIIYQLKEKLNEVDIDDESK